MTDHPFARLTARGKEPASANVLNAWIQQAQVKVDIAPDRLGWLVASTVVIAALQRAVYADGQPRFLLKGGAYLEHRLGLNARATKDVDTLFRGDFGEFLAELDAALRDPWGPITLRRTEISVIEGARTRTKPRRFDIQLLIRGKVWRRIQVEVAPDEGGAGGAVDALRALPLDHFGLPSARKLAGIALDYQVAQKLHACTDPHDPPDLINDRARDVIDLVLLRQTFYPEGADLSKLAAACLDVFQTRAREAEALGGPSRSWPPQVVAYAHWERDYLRPASQADIELSLHDAIEHINSWIGNIAIAAH